MKIIHLITTLERGGAEIAVKNLAIQQAKLHDVEILFLKGVPELESSLSDGGVSVNKILWQKRLSRQLFEVIFFLKQKDSNTIFHCHLPRSELIGLFGVVFSRSKTKFCVTRHNSEPFFPRIPHKLSSFLSRVVTGKAYLIIAISNAVGAYLRANHEVSRCRDVHIIHYGYERKVTPPPRAKNKSNSELSAVRLGLIARLEHQKGIDLAIETSSVLEKEGFAHTISILGEGSEKNFLRQLASDHGVAKNIHFLGKRSEVTSLLSQLDLIIFPSRYEGLGLVLLEAMDFNIPIIASDIPSTLEVLGKNHPGLFRKGDTREMAIRIKSIARNSAVIKNILIIQNRQLSLFSMDKYLQKHLDLYEDLNK